jgi:glycosyltransferase involved in cell wall biosynthesis
MPVDIQVSIIIPTFNRPHLLPKAIESARAAGTNVEVVVVDDASIDSTAAVCREMSDIKYVRLKHNLGTAAARNVGLLESTGRYIGFLDDDDLRLAGSIDQQVSALEKNPAAGFTCGAMIMADQEYQRTGEIIAPENASGDIFWDLIELSFPVMPLSTLIRRECFLRIGLLNQRLNGIDDWDILTRIAEVYPVEVLKEPVGLYRQPTPQSGQGSSSQARQLRRAARHQLNLLQLPRAFDAGARRRSVARRRALDRISDTLLASAVRQLSSNEYRAASENIRTAMGIAPLRAVRPGAYKKLASKLFLN